MKFVRFAKEQMIPSFDIDKILKEALSYKRAKVGETQFRKSQLNDPHIQKAIQEISDKTGTPISEIEHKILEKVRETNELAKLAPVLYHTIKDNLVENEVFTLYWKSGAGEGPKFSPRIFYSIINAIKAEKPRFYPLRGEIDKRILHNIDIILTDDAQDVPTAAATPDGKFIFNNKFMQALINYAHTIGLKPKGSKYVSNGGKIPDEYAYIEFLIMHEFMHYSKDDFYYQKIIPNANSKIINWVGDFRSNYTLVKSGYEPLPIGLFNDMINFDRQKSYMEMYNLIKEEFEKLPKEDQDKISSDVDEKSDDHRPGNESGEKKKVPSDVKVSDIEEHNKRITSDVENETPQTDKPKDQPKSNQQKSGTPGSGGGSPSSIDYSNIKPTFNWSQLVAMFINTAKPRSEETYAKPARRNVTGLDILASRGASAIKPGEKQFSVKDSKLGFVFDSSGSMGETILTVMSNVVNLLKQPQFRDMETTSIVFGGENLLYKTVYGRNKAAKVNSVNEKPQTFPLSADVVYKTHQGGGTLFSEHTAAELALMLKNGYNVILFSDADILFGENYTHFTKVLHAYPKQMFVVFDSHDTYAKFRQHSQFTTKNITHF